MQLVQPNHCAQMLSCAPHGILSQVTHSQAATVAAKILYSRNHSCIHLSITGLAQHRSLPSEAFKARVLEEALQSFAVARLHTGRRHRFKALASSFASFSARFMAEPTSNPHPDNWTLPMSGLGHGPFCPRFPLPFPQLTEPRLSERDKEAWTLRVLS